jgi:hypothetical protein
MLSSSSLCVCRWSFDCRSCITYSLSLSSSLSPASHQELTHIMASDEEGSEYLSDGGDAVASRQRKHARDERDSLQKMAKASKQAKVLLSPNPYPYPLSIPYPYPYPLSIAKHI